MGVTQSDVARAANVSRALVSLVMRDSPQVSQAKRSAVLEAAAQLGYRRNTHAAQLASHRAMILGAVIPQLGNALHAQVLGAAEEESERHGYGILPTLGDMDAEQESASINRLLGHQVDGILLLGTNLPAEDVRQVARHVPVVSTGRLVPGVDSVEVDGREGAMLAVHHLVDLGHRSIAYVTGGDSAGADDRRDGYVEAMRGAGLTRETRIEEGDGTEAGGITAARRLLGVADRPTAIFAFNDLSATGVLAVAREAGLSVPADLSLVGFDDSPLSSLQCINLSTVAQPRPLLAAESVTLLLARIADPARPATLTHVPPRLVVRASSGPA